MTKRSKVEISRTIRGPIPHVPFDRIAHETVGADYHLSLVLCADTLARRINRSYRQKSYSPNVLSFNLSKNEGEIFLNVRKAEREAKSAGTTARARTALLFVHGCLHLAGYRHGRKMEDGEDKILRRLGY